MTTDQQLIDLIKPIIAAAKAVDHRINCAVVNVSDDSEQAFIGVYGDFAANARPASGYEVEAMLASLKPFDPKAEKLAAIEKLKSELAALEKDTATNEPAAQ